MGNVTSKSARRTLSKSNILHSERAVKVHVDIPPKPGRPEGLDIDAKDEQIGTLLLQLGGSITGKNVVTHKADKPTQPAVAHRRRIREPALKALLHEYARLGGQGAANNDVVRQLASKYSVDEQALQKVLHYNSVPVNHSS